MAREWFDRVARAAAESDRSAQTLEHINTASVLMDAPTRARMYEAQAARLRARIADCDAMRHRADELIYGTLSTTLPPIACDVLHLRYVQGLPWKQVARICGRSKTVCEVAARDAFSAMDGLHVLDCES